MKIYFSKYHGTGNDFIMIDERNNVSFPGLRETISALCDRHFGIGADGLIVIRATTEADFHMDFYNSDGNPGSMCGNGGRCSVAFAKDIGLIPGTCTFLAPDGLHHGTSNPDGTYTINLRDVSGVTYYGDDIFLNTGSPHYIRFVPSVDEIDMNVEGKLIRHNNRFEGGTNANFVEYTDRGIKVRTFERGVEAETLSCGTGVTAATIASFLRKPELGTDVFVETRGGNLRVQFKPSTENTFKDLLLTGPAIKAFDGETEL